MECLNRLIFTGKVKRDEGGGSGGCVSRCEVGVGFDFRMRLSD